MKISVVSPIYKGEKYLEELVIRVESELKKFADDYEIILVEDCGPDNSWDKIVKVCKENQKVKGIKLSRNFGQHYAITAGLEHSSGDWVVVMDCDLQDVPEEIGNLFDKTKEGFDIVFARRVERMDSFFKRQSSRVFYKTFGYLTDTNQDSTIANFGIYSNKVVEAILSMKDSIRYFPTMSQWVGFSKGYLDVKHAAREEDASSYSWKSLLNLAFNNIIAFSDKPLRLTVKLGVIISLLSFLLGIYTLIQHALGKVTEVGYTSLILSIWFLSGLIIIVLGIIGIYVGKTFDKVKDRPVYIVDKVLNNG